jgi:hypothetical protein
MRADLRHFRVEVADDVHRQPYKQWLRHECHAWLMPVAEARRIGCEGALSRPKTSARPDREEAYWACPVERLD